MRHCERKRWARREDMVSEIELNWWWCSGIELAGDASELFWEPLVADWPASWRAVWKADVSSSMGFLLVLPLPSTFLYILDV